MRLTHQMRVLAVRVCPVEQRTCALSPCGLSGSPRGWGCTSPRSGQGLATGAAEGSRLIGRCDSEAETTR